MKVTFTFEPYLCGMSNVKGGFNLELNLADSLFDNSDTAHVGWDGEKMSWSLKGIWIKQKHLPEITKSQ